MIYLTHESELNIDDLTVLYFYTSWMPYHTKITTMIPKVEGFQFVAIDADYFKKVVSRFSVESVPTFVTIVNKKVIGTLTGVTYTKAFLTYFKNIKDSYDKRNQKQKDHESLPGAGDPNENEERRQD
jgi:thioredoxin-like negative regulator of GroEL